MASKSVSLTQPYGAQQAEIDRRRAMAMALQQEGMSPLEMPQQAGVKISPLEGIAKLLSIYLGDRAQKKQADKQQTLDMLKQVGLDQRSQALAQTIMPSAEGGARQVGAGMSVPSGQPGMAPIPGSFQQAMPPTNEAIDQRSQQTRALAQALASSDPAQQAFAQAKMADILSQGKEQRTQNFTGGQNDLNRAVTMRGQDLTQGNYLSEAALREAQAQAAADKVTPIPQGAAIPDPQNPGKFIVPSPQPTPVRNIDPNSPEGIAARIKVAQNRPPLGDASQGDIKDTARGIMEGMIPPNISQSVSYRDRTGVSAELTRNGYDLATAARDWAAIKTHLSTLNGAQQERLRQAISFTTDTLPQIQEAYNEWKRQGAVSGLKVFNKAALATSKQFPGKAGSAAQQLESLVADFTSELGTVYKGGNSSTDESLQLAAKNLSGDWNEQTFTDAINRLNTSLKIRKNSINSSEAQGVSPNSPYAPGAGTASPAAPTSGFRIVP